MKNARFGRLLKGAIGSIAVYEGKTAPVIEDELGAQIGLSGASIQRYKAGHIPPEARTVEILAEAAVKRGYLNREWLQNFLSAAYYPVPERLLDQLGPVAPARQHPPRVYENLPAPTYSQFVMRREPYNEVVDGLRQRSAVVLIASLGGMGKTSLAREVAARCLQEDGDAPRFDAAVWVSDKDRPGTTTLSLVLDEIARTLDYPGFTQYEHEEKLREIEQLLRRQHVLLVIDNFETITDGALLAWLLRLPEPSKAIVTTREYRREFRRGTWPIELRGMSESEAREFIAQRLRMLKIEKMVTDISQLAPLVAATGGNPKALEMALGYIKYQHQPIQHVIDDLYAARGDVFDDLFTRAWALLDEAARRVLLAMALFPSSASSEALSVTADVKGFAFDNAIERLVDLALLDAQQSNLNTLPRYALHPLVRAFAGARLVEDADVKRRAIRRWADYFQRFAEACKEHGWDDPAIYDRVETDIANVQAVMQYCHDTQQWASLISLVMTFIAFWGTRGYYDTRNRFVDLALEAAELSGDWRAQIGLLSTKARAYCYQDNVQEATACCERAKRLLAANDPSDTYVARGISFAEIRIAQLSNDVDRLRALAQVNLDIYASRGEKRATTIAGFDLAEYYLRVERFDEAVSLTDRLIEECRSLNLLRAPIRGWLFKAEIALRTGQLALADEYLRQALDMAQRLQHRRYLVEGYRVKAQLSEARRQTAAARAELREAISLAERLGLRRELTEAREELARLEAEGLSSDDAA